MLSDKTHVSAMEADENGTQIPASDPNKPKVELDWNMVVVREQAQKIADAMVAKKLKGMPTKAEIAEWKKWKTNQKSERARAAETQKVVDEATRIATALLLKTKAKIIAIYMGVERGHLDDAAILAVDRICGEVTAEMAMKEIIAKNPSWCSGDV